MESQMQIGEVAERTGLSLRTIRYYGEVELVTPSSRTEGGFRLYTDADVAKLELIKQMKPLGYSIEEMREVFDILAELEAGPTAPSREALTARLITFRNAATAGRDKLAARLAAAESFIELLDQHVDRTMRT